MTRSRPCGFSATNQQSEAFTQDMASSVKTPLDMAGMDQVVPPLKVERRRGGFWDTTLSAAAMQ
jgi:hypothetical protein